MQDDNKLNDPLKDLREELNTQQPSEKPANDVLESENSGAGAESQFVHSTREELNDETAKRNPSADKSVPGNSGSTMPSTERLTEND